MPIKTIVVAVAGGTASIITAKYAIYLAKILTAKLIAINVINEKVLQDLIRSRVVVDIEARVYENDLEEQGRLFLEKVKKAAETKQVEYASFILKGVVHEEIVRKAKELGASLLVMGSMREVMSRREVYTEEGERILREATCPVFIVKNQEEVERLYKEI